MMIYLSKLTFDMSKWEARRDLNNPYEMHRTLMRAFASKANGGPGRVLFRIELAQADCSPVVLVQSDKQPDWSKLDLGSLVVAPQCKSFSPRFVADQRVMFRLRANPTSRHRSDDGITDGKRLGLFTEVAQMAWLARKGNLGGFQILSVKAAPEGIVRTIKEKTGSPLTHFAVRFDGMIAVIDPVLFEKILMDGVGPAKGFGFGLLSLARAT